ncbi:beta-ketoacyl synthase N-terminal-like domain-containing protein [Nocardiopsis alba]|uniref:beta-ketoacyl synthase N-terminal-like domain-containing protein n=1 Tax=Nocardiopsis alba TaxID=53437 RepID=UPI0033BC67F9
MRTPVPSTSAALTGIGLRLPGGSGPDLRGPDRAWNALLAAESAIGRYPEERWRAMAERLHPEDRSDTPWPVAHLTLPEAGSLDATVLGMRATEGAHLSPTQTLVTQVVAEAIADAGLAPSTLAGPSTGVYLGNATPDEALTTFGRRSRPGLVDLASGGAGMLATPVSRWLDTRGPLVTFDTSCSASMAALDAAHRDLAQGRVDTAIVIGTNTCADPVVIRAFVEGGVLAEDGACLPYDVGARGYVRGEAVVAVVLRRYSRARADQDRVYALIDHTLMGADGRSAGTGMPSRPAQAELLTRVYDQAGLSPERVDYLIGHGTATRAGDRAELAALRQVFDRPERDRPLLVGSVKGLWGHAEAASALTGVVAAALSLHHGIVPPTTGHTEPNPDLGEGLTVATEAVEIPPKVVGVTGLGFSGAIGHTIMSRVPAAARGRRGGLTSASVGGALALPVSSPTESGVRAAAEVLAPAVAGPGRARAGRIGDHLVRRRDHHRVRAAVLSVPNTAGSAEAWEALAQGRSHPDLVGPTEGRSPWRQVWVFGGQGSAHPRMGLRLRREDPMFAEHLEAVLRELELPWRPGDTGELGLAFLQQATFAVQVALAHTLRDRYGLVPDAVVGHSMGEVAAAHVAGILPLDQAARLARARSTLLERIVHEGGLVAAQLDAHEAQELTDRYGLEIACRNSPRDVVLSGDRDSLDALVADLTERGVRNTRVSQAPPAHSRHVEGLQSLLAAELEGLRPEPGEVEMVSTVTGRPIVGTDLTADYWVRQLRAPVEFEQATISCASGATLAVEISPRPVLGPAMAHTRARHHLTLDITAAGDPEHEPLGPARVAAHAYTHHIPLTWPFTAACAPLEVEPAPWTPSVSDRWTDRIAHLEGVERHAVVLDQVHREVADLAAVEVTDHDLDTDLADLGVNSLHLLSLRATLLQALPQRPTALPDHQPTIRSIAKALEELLPPPATNTA